MPGTQTNSGVTKSPYEPGVYFVRGQTWQVKNYMFAVVVTTTSLDSFTNMWDNLQIGEGYELLKQLGSGSFSEVCLAEDRSTGEKVNSAKPSSALLP